METQMRFRTDGAHYGDYKMAGVTAEQLKEWSYSEEEIEKYRNYPSTQPGDTWRIRWYKEGGEGPIAGYAICCPKCNRIHHWTTATNCGQTRDASYTDKDGKTVSYKVCIHSGTGSCWTWTGSAEDNTLTASPSLYCQESLGGCGWHGFLQNGILRG